MLTGKEETVSGDCHYCGQEATTRDHIVPQKRVRKLALPANHPFHSLNVVPACRGCNESKSAKFPTCDCDTCGRAVRKFHGLAQTYARQ